MGEIKQYHKKRLIRFRYLQSLLQLRGEVDLSPELLNLNPAQSTQYAETRSIIYDASQGLGVLQNRLATYASNPNRQLLDSFTRGVTGDVRKAGEITDSYNLADTGWVIGTSFAELVYSRARMPIGIREIAFGDLSYETIGTIVSKEYRTAQVIREVSLLADEFIPPEYPTGDTYIKYEISFDSVVFYEIVPENRLTAVAEPQIIIVNAGVPAGKNTGLYKEVTIEDPPRSLRVKITLMRPAGNDFAKTSPVLKSYRLKVKTS